MNFPQPNEPEHSDNSAAPSIIPPERPALPSIESGIFLDSEGMRPIWGITLFLILWELLRQFIFPLFEAIFPSPSGGTLIPARHEFVLESASLLSVSIATWLMAKFEGRTFGAYGFNPQQAMRRFLLGLATGAVLLSALVVALRVSGLLIFDARLLFGRSILRAGLIWTVGFLLVAFAEEMLLRGYLQFALTRALASVTQSMLPSANARRTGFWTAAIVLSIAFGYSHNGNPGESPLGLINAVLVGLVFCLSLWRTGSLWWAIGFHTAWDWAQSFLYGVPDSGLMVQGHLFATHPAGRTVLSGGLTGPEGSIFLLPIALVACAAICLTLPRTAIPDQLEKASATTPALDLP